MKERFESPPLVELIAEVRWNARANDAVATPFLVDSNNQVHEEFFSRLLTELGGQGYGASERMVPVGFPLINQHPVIRYLKNAKPPAGHDNSASTLFQVGVGIFTVNAVQPYKSWDQFRPVVVSGLEALMASAPPRESGFTVSLRYVDAFKEELTEGRTHRQFLEEILGIQVIVPEILRKISRDGSTVIPMMHMVTPLEFGTLQIQFAEGQLSGEPVFLMENVVTVADQFDGNVTAMMEGLDQARGIVHTSFVGMTRPLHEKMKLSEVP